MQNLSFQFAMQKLKYVATNKALHLIFCNAISQFFNVIFFKPPVGKVIVCNLPMKRSRATKGQKLLSSPSWPSTKMSSKASKILTSMIFIWQISWLSAFSSSLSNSFQDYFDEDKIPIS